MDPKKIRKKDRGFTKKMINLSGICVTDNESIVNRENDSEYIVNSGK